MSTVNRLQGKIAMVTGVAGFIGSSLAARLLREGCRVIGVDKFTDYYDPSVKRANLKDVDGRKEFELHEIDAASSGMASLVSQVDVVFHLAAQPGVRGSWGEGFDSYVTENISATQRLLEVVRRNGSPRIVLGSSSSVYGSGGPMPSLEGGPTGPHSPYGITKLAAEQLCRSYAANWGVHVAILRFFTVYGPRQRPDMAMHRLLESARTGRPFTLMGDGSQIRDFTFVSDVVQANVAAACTDLPNGSTMNVSGGSQASLSEVMQIVEDVTGKRVDVVKNAEQPGDVRQTRGSSQLIRELLNWAPSTNLADGIAAQWYWHQERAGLGMPAGRED